MDELFLKIALVQNPGSTELAGFTHDVEGFLKFVVGDQQNFGFLWDTNQKLRRMAQATLDNDVVPAAGELRDAIPSIPLRSLKAHGLRGRALRFKLNVIASLARRWESVKGTLSVRGWLKQIIDAIDALLESLIDAAGGAGGLVKEFKDALSALVPVA